MVLPKACLIVLAALFVLCIPKSILAQDESDLIKTDRHTLALANKEGISSKIMAARERLSDDMEVEAKVRRKEAEGIAIPLFPDGQGHLYADVLINDKVHASLIVDTGSPTVVLTAPLVAKLGLNLSQAPRGFVNMLSNKYNAAGVFLGSLKVGSVKAVDIRSAALLGPCGGIKDGLLGMTFLRNFHFILDDKDQKLILRK